MIVRVTQHVQALLLEPGFTQRSVQHHQMSRGAGEAKHETLADYRLPRGNIYQLRDMSAKAFSYSTCVRPAHLHHRCFDASPSLGLLLIALLFEGSCFLGGFGDCFQAVRLQ
jgi:hypothetical protein